jgi:phage FluMu protein gp41
MIEYNLNSFIAKHSRRAAASILNVSRVAIGYALRANRDIRFVEHGDGSFSAYEVKQLSTRVKLEM